MSDGSLLPLKLTLSATTQGPMYPAAEVVDKDGNFVVVGYLQGKTGSYWGKALVSPDSELPEFGQTAPYTIIQDLEELSDRELSSIELYTLPLPIPMNNYKMLFAPEQAAEANSVIRGSLPLNVGYIQDYRESDGKRNLPPINLYDWLKAEGSVEISQVPKSEMTRFEFVFRNLVPNSLYTVMSLRKHDLRKDNPTRPGPLGIPNVFMTDQFGNATYWAELPSPFSDQGGSNNPVINIIVLFMSSRQSHGGAIGLYGLGGDVHAHLKLTSPLSLNS